MQQLFKSSVSKVSDLDRTGFEQQWFDESLIYIRISLILTIGLVLFFYPFDPLIVNAESAQFLRFCRIYVLVPALVLLLILSYQQIAPRIYYLCSAAIFTMGGSVFIYSGYLSPIDSALHVLISLIQTIALMLIALRIPWKISVPCAVFLYLYASYVTLTVIQTSVGSIYAFVTGFGAATAVMCISAYLRDQDAMKLYLAHKSQEALQAEQLDWSKLITRFLRHELSNQLTAISTSVLLSKRAEREREREMYFERAETAIQLLRDLLNKTTMATNITDALSVVKPEPFSISELLADNLFEMEGLYPDVCFDFKIETDFDIKGDSMLLSRAIANLIENAVRHKKEGSPVKLVASSKRSILVENEGDPLPPDQETMFNVGHDGESNNTGLFGMGLFVVRKVMEAHGGTVSVQPLRDEVKQGACFELHFPE